MKKPQNFVALANPPGDVRTLIGVAVITTPRQVVCRRWSAMLFSNDVIDLKRVEAGGFWKAAILAEATRARHDKPPKLFVHGCTAKVNLALGALGAS